MSSKCLFSHTRSELDIVGRETCLIIDLQKLIQLFDIYEFKSSHLYFLPSQEMNIMNNLLLYIAAAFFGKYYVDS